MSKSMEMDIWNIGIFVSFGFTIFGLYFFTANLIDLIKFPRY